MSGLPASARGGPGRACVLGAVALGVLVLIAACTARPQRAPPAEPVADRAVAEALSAARLAYERGNFAQANTLYRRALARAEAVDAAAQAADAAYNAAISEIGLRNYAAARPLLERAEYDAARVGADTSEIRLVRAKLAYLEGDMRQATALADAIAASAAPARLVVQARILRGQVFADGGDLAAAGAELRWLETRAGPGRVRVTPASAADIEKLAGTIARREGRVAAAAQAFDREAALLRIARRHRDMAHALARAAAAYRDTGRSALAAQRYYLAGRSLAAQRDDRSARALAAASLDAAEAAGDAAARARARRLLEEISRRAAP